MFNRKIAKNMEHTKGLSAHRDRSITLRFLAEPTDVNFGGKVHGGAVMKWIDQAGYACATAWAASYCVTVYVGGIKFMKPIRIGDLVEVEAKVILTGKTSMHVTVDVRAGNLKERTWVQTTHCVMVFVAVDEEGNPTEVAAWQPDSEDDHALEQYARRLMELRKGIDEEMSKRRAN